MLHNDTQCDKEKPLRACAVRGFGSYCYLLRRCFGDPTAIPTNPRFANCARVRGQEKSGIPSESRCGLNTRVRIVAHSINILAAPSQSRPWACGPARSAMNRAPAVQPKVALKVSFPIRRTHTLCPMLPVVENETRHSHQPSEWRKLPFKYRF